MKDYAEQMLPFCYGFVLFSLFFAIFSLFNLLSAERTSAAQSYRTLSQVYLSDMRLYQVICAQMINYSHFFLITKRILRKELLYIAGTRRLLIPILFIDCRRIAASYLTLSFLRRQESRPSHFV
jgi:hypothetical protein